MAGSTRHIEVLLPAATGGSVTGTGLAALGGLTGTAVGKVTVTATGAAGLGGLAGTAVGKVTVTATAVATLGGLTAVVIGKRTTTGSGLAALGGLTGTIVVAGAVVVVVDPTPVRSITWTGPQIQTRSLVSPDPIEWARNPLGQRLMSHYGAQAEGVNVYLLRNGTVTTEDPIDWDTVAHVLWGAHVEPITEAEAALLTAAGYGAYINVELPPASPPVGFVDSFGGDFG